MDVGAGTGAFAAAMQKANWNVTALNPMQLQGQMQKTNFNIVLQPSEQLFSLKNESFDVITLWHVLEHVHDLHNYINIFFLY